MRTEKELIEKQIDVTKTLCENCPRFKFCSVNNCPLHEDYKKLKSFSSDFEAKCKLGKTRKKRLLRNYMKKVREDDTTKENLPKQHLRSKIQENRGKRGVEE